MRVARFAAKGRDVPTQPPTRRATSAPQRMRRRVGPPPGFHRSFTGLRAHPTDDLFMTSGSAPAREPTSGSPAKAVLDVGANANFTREAPSLRVFNMPQ